MSSPRDVFFNEVISRTRLGQDIYIVSADFGCKAIDDFKQEFPSRYINVGIAEQNAILVAAGLALEGKTVFVYGIASFIVCRCYEQIKVVLNGMDLPVTFVCVGANDDYKEDGFTHWAFDDVNLLSQLENVYIFRDDLPMEDIPLVVNCCIEGGVVGLHPKYVRLRRK